MNDTTFQGDGKVAYVPVVVNAKLTKPSNADRIRSMTDEELAEFINDVWDRLLFGNDLPGMCDVCYTDTIQNCKKCWLDWLRQEVNLNEGSDNLNA